jgi:HEAT repeat protein
VDLGAPAVEALTRELERFGGPTPANALIRIGEPAVEPVIKILDAQAAWARYQAARILGEIGGTRELDVLSRLLEKEKNKEVLEVAKNAVERIKRRNNIV